MYRMKTPHSELPRVQREKVSERLRSKLRGIAPRKGLIHATKASKTAMCQYSLSVNDVREIIMIGHLGINVTDLQRAKIYYDTLMPLLEFEPFLSHSDQFAYRPAHEKPGTYLFFYPARESGQFSPHKAGLQHLAFIVRSRSAVHRIYDQVKRLKSPVIHPPQEFPQYHPGYYAMFWRDPEGFMLEAVCHRRPTEQREQT